MLYLEDAFAITLKEIRNNIGLSQEELAHRCNVDRTYISLLERKLRRPTLNVLFKLYSELGIKPSQFVLMVENKIDKK